MSFVRGFGNNRAGRTAVHCMAQYGNDSDLQLKCTNLVCKLSRIPTYRPLHSINDLKNVLHYVNEAGIRDAGGSEVRSSEQGSRQQCFGNEERHTKQCYHAGSGRQAATPSNLC